MTDGTKKYPLQECVMTIRSDPKSSYGFSDEKVFEIFMNTEIKTEKDIDILLIEILVHRKNLVDRFCEEVSKLR